MRTDVYLRKEGRAVSEHIRCGDLSLGHELVLDVGDLHMVLYRVPGDNRLALRLNPLCSGKTKLVASGDAALEHSMGRTDARQTVLTRREFCGRLERLRALFGR